MPMMAEPPPSAPEPESEPPSTRSQSRDEMNGLLAAIHEATGLGVDDILLRALRREYAALVDEASATATLSRDSKLR